MTSPKPVTGANASRTGRHRVGGAVVTLLRSIEARVLPDRSGLLHARRLAAPALAALLLALPTHAAANDQCGSGERVVFSCTVAKARVVSVCRSAGAGGADASLVYRFGRPGQPELVFPASPRGSMQQFRYAHYFRSQTDRSELSFETDAARYTVYDYFEGDQKPATSRGVRVVVDGRELDLRCIGPVVSRLAELAEVVPCDADNALASCR